MVLNSLPYYAFHRRAKAEKIVQYEIAGYYCLKRAIYCPLLLEHLSTKQLYFVCNVKTFQKLRLLHISVSIEYVLVLWCTRTYPCQKSFSWKTWQRTCKESLMSSIKIVCRYNLIWHLHLCTFSSILTAAGGLMMMMCRVSTFVKI